MSEMASSVHQKIAALSQGKARLLEAIISERTAGSSQELRAIPRVAEGGRIRLPASGAQQRLWFIDQLEGSSTSYHIQTAFRLHGSLDRAALQAAFNALIDRHEALRTVFAQVDGEPIQEILPEATLSLRYADLRARSRHTRELDVVEYLREQGAEPFDLARDVPIRTALLQLADEEHVLLITVHHIVSDGWSIGVLLRELGLLYDAHLRGAADPLPPLAIQYGDYAKWQRSQFSRQQHQLDYWKEHLRGAPDLLDLPTDRPRPAVQTFLGGGVSLPLGAALTADLKAFSRKFDLTLAMTLHTAWSILLARLSGQDDIVAGVPMANRKSGAVAELIGLFVNTLPVRVRVASDMSVGALLSQVKQAMLDAYEHQQVPFEEIVKAVQPARRLSHSAIFQATFVFHNGPPAALNLAGVTSEEMRVPLQTTHFDVALHVQEVSGELIARLNYACSMFDGETMQRWLGCLRTLLREITLQPQAYVRSLPLMNEDERCEVVESFNATEEAWPEGGLINQRFEEQVRRTPRTAAVVWNGNYLTYAELNAKANRLARHLRSLGVGPDRRIALYVERGLEMIVGMLAVLKAGGAYVPLDPIHPVERLKRVVADCQPVVLLTQPALPGLIEQGEECARVCVDMASWAQSPWADADSGDLEADDLKSSHLAYVTYTSGSTGEPKGVMVEHRNVLHFLHGLEQRIHGVAPDCRRIAWNSSFGFDMSVKAWGQLLAGRTVYVVPETVRFGGGALLDFIEENRIEAIECTPTHLRAMLDAGLLRRPARSLRKVLLGGEALDSQTWQELAAADDIDFFNMYGPTECSVDISCGRIAGERPNIGRVMPNAKVYILDEQQQPVPIGVVGEIHAGGSGVARGYLNRDQLTADRFVRDPFSTLPDARMYRTGDLGRWCADGTIEYVGRNDQQVKIRGFRIELGDIEAQLKRHEEVGQVAVIVREDAPGEKRLVAYITLRNSSDAAADREALRAHLKSLLPEYMIPAAFVTLKHLPFTANGKLDRGALPVPDVEALSTRDFEAPVGRVEEALAGIWQTLLRVERVGRRDNFFALGGHSLLIVRMLEHLDGFGLSGKVRDVFEQPTLADIARVLSEEPRDELVVPPNLIPERCGAITPDMLTLVTLEPSHIELIVQAIPGGAANIEDIYPLSPLQEGLFFHYLMSARAGDVYVVPMLLSVASRKRLDDLIAALQSAIDRHAVLRTAILWEHLPHPVQVVQRRATLPVETVSLDRKIDSILQVRMWMDVARQHMDLHQAPLLRLRIAEDPDSRRWYALLQMHHIASDNTSQEVIVSEVLAQLKGRVQALRESLPYREHVARALAYARTNEADRYFASKLGDLDEPTAPFGLLDVHGSGNEVDVAEEALDSDLSQRVRLQSRRYGVNTATLFHAAWALVVAAASGRGDVVFGTVLLGRLQGIARSERALGLFINTLPLRLKLQGLSIRELVELTQRELGGLLAHEQAALGVAQRCSRISGSGPLFSSLLNYRQGTRNPDFEWSSAQGICVLDGHGFTNYPVAASVDESADGFTLTTQTDRRIVAGRVAAYLRTALRSIVGALERAPQSEALLLPVLPSEETHKILEEFASVQVTHVVEGLAHEMFEEQALRTPGAVAASFGNHSLSYVELNERANQLARHLVKLGVGPERIVGLHLERGLDLVVGILGILKAGGAYLPLDPSYPAERLAYMLQDAAPAVVLTQKHLKDSLPPTEASVLELDVADLGSYEKQNLDSCAMGLSRESLAYVIYTSGSTGRPKGVLLEHHGLSRLASTQRHAFALSSADRVLQFSSVSFDACTWEWTMALCSGAHLCLASREDLAPGEPLYNTLRDLRITHATLPPVAVSALPSSAGLASLRTLIVAGEACSAALVDQWAPGRQFINAYGPTENTVCATMHECHPDVRENPPIGRPIPNVQIYILDARQQPVPIGAVGEIHIGGEALARGYLGRPEMTRERFVRNPFSADPLGRLYRTGDLGRWLNDGAIEYLGRNDHQVKIRGHRIELGEIEAHLARHEHVRAAVVVAREDVPGEKRLVAYLVPATPGVPDAAQLREYLRELLPEYMLPAAFVMLESLPVTPNGKVDRRALPAPDPGAYAAREYEAPEGEVEEVLAGLWKQLLGVERIGRRDSFFELGGHSLVATRAIARIRDLLSVNLALKTIFDSPRLAELAMQVRLAREAESAEDARRERHLARDFAKEISEMDEEAVSARLVELERGLSRAGGSLRL